MHDEREYRTISHVPVTCPRPVELHASYPEPHMHMSLSALGMGRDTTGRPWGAAVPPKTLNAAFRPSKHGLPGGRGSAIAATRKRPNSACLEPRQQLTKDNPTDPHHLLAQVPLTVSPFLSLPTATPLPYTYKQLPSTLPPSILSSPPANNSDPNASSQPAYIVSATGTTATPDQILSSCLALQSHLTQLEQDARKTLKEWEERRKAADLAEKRRVAPGWLDGEVKILRPENVPAEQDAAVEEGEHTGSRQQPQRRTSVGIKGLIERRDGIPDPSEGEALDRAFGGLDIK